MKELEKLLFIMKSLRDPDTGCPWDKEQTIDSIKGYTIEEAYEVVDAIERQNMDDLKDELGDLLFHIIFYSEMANEENYFNFTDVVKDVGHKLERRHPHVFSDKEVENVEQVKHLWEKIKADERKNKKNNATLLADINKNMPATQRALKLQKRAASVGFDWDDSKEILNKIDEELGELKEAIKETESVNIKNLTEELGDLMFCCINLARHYRVDPEQALRETNEKFINRFNYIEEALKKQNKTLEDASLDEMDRLWNKAKTEIT